MHSEAWLNLLQQERAIAVIRAPDLPTGVAMAQAMYAGGLRLLEVTWGSVAPDRLVRELCVQLPDCVIGAGTITQMWQLEQAQQAGAQFIFAPGTDAGIIVAAVAAQLPMVPGALTPSEILMAQRLGASSVKVFPIQAVGGATYLRSLRIPLAGVPLVPTGGVTLNNAAAMIEAGAIAVGMAGDLFPAAAIANGEWDVLQGQARRLVESLMPYRQV
ncbi:bifunctional 4-hydroxy-2-oxoglutarate aldolase/2-dehydro-3-deoxy-phosphogluconate aldolase [filamentous cyanobacterium LEGE 11480]|uniref:Bifunctional 4-hydroxy-2-oxoglutarate aldolase/2-dehydro-3-deoxy-phosphogluconate aldolase n=1 Tax=Romeriopsis navalis LEGE 11480 TaxID=2777977 RepID=A0A928Z2Z9_9CYAN|nr:bifunctional 4-hydroxy-2-oxoglutarate aldolase/2-dehydro-3-deoxy-phosphogluconate aldolase [Romeriopsis navalis]MBE9028668.1 bifunctional 4-hydroxy-2-oxoglutarate aldolase/2-dehydro-3-deoxy-phosphogluconate aldolase [Romeriopsis navalis LEGE 11480]